MEILNSAIAMLRPSHAKVRFNQYAAHVALVPAIICGTPVWWVASLFTFYLFHGLGSGCGAHRYFTHRSFAAKRWAEILMALLFTFASSGSVIGYVLIHHRHHKHADNAKDPHSPSVMGAWKTWFGFLNKNGLTLDPRAYMRLRSDPVLRILHDYYFFVIGFYCFAISLLFGWQGLIFLYCLPVALQFHANSALIVLTHMKMVGYRSYETPEGSRNLPYVFRFWLLGEELHNNHHYRPASSTMNVSGSWRQGDPLALVIRFFLQRTENA